MKAFARFVILVIALCSVLGAQPVISGGGVMNAASYTLPGLPYYGIAQGSMFVILGQNMGPDTLQIAPEIPLPTQLAGTSVTVTVDGTTVDSIMYYSSAAQLACILPSNTPTGEGTVTVTYNGQSSDPAPILVVKSAPGIFTWNSAGLGQAVVQNHISQEVAPVPNAMNRPAKPGQTMIIWATGLGPISEDDASAPPVVDLTDLGLDVKVVVGNSLVEPDYAGRTGAGFPSIDQINFVVPADIQGCRVPLALIVDGVVSNYTTMAISSSGETCSDRTEMPASALEKLAANNGGAIGVIELMRSRGEFVTSAGNLPVNMDIGTAAFYQRDLQQILAGQHLRASDLQTAPPVEGTCIFHAFPGAGTLKFHPTDPVPLIPMDAGSSLTVTGPTGMKEIGLMAPTVPGIFSGTLGGGLPGGEILPDYLEDGEYTVSNGSEGGQSAVGSFTASVSLPPSIIWTNSEAITEVPRDQDLVITWEGGDPNTQLAIVLVASADSNADISGTVTCTATVDAGSLTIPPRVLGSLPASTPWNFTGLPSAVLFVGTIPTADGTIFEAPGLDLGLIHYGDWQFRNVDVR